MDLPERLSLNDAEGAADGGYGCGLPYQPSEREHQMLLYGVLPNNTGCLFIVSNSSCIYEAGLNTTWNLVQTTIQNGSLSQRYGRELTSSLNLGIRRVYREGRVCFSDRGDCAKQTALLDTRIEYRRLPLRDKTKPRDKEL